MVRAVHVAPARCRHDGQVPVSGPRSGRVASVAGRWRARGAAGSWAWRACVVSGPGQGRHCGGHGRLTDQPAAAAQSAARLSCERPDLGFVLGVCPSRTRPAKTTERTSVGAPGLSAPNGHGDALRRGEQAAQRAAELRLRGEALTSGAAATPELATRAADAARVAADRASVARELVAGALDRAAQTHEEAATLQTASRSRSALERASIGPVPRSIAPRPSPIAATPRRPADAQGNRGRLKRPPRSASAGHHDVTGR